MTQTSLICGLTTYKRELEEKMIHVKLDIGQEVFLNIQLLQVVDVRKMRQ